MKSYASLWAKSGRDGKPFHSLIAHMLDVAAVALEILRREPASTITRYARALNCRPEEAEKIIAWSAAIHDLGKATPSFQAKWEPGCLCVREAGLRFPSSRHNLPDVPHGAMTTHLLDRWMRKRNASLSFRRAVSRIVGAHHGFVPTDDEVRQAENIRALGDNAWTSAREELLADISHALGLSEECLCTLIDKVPDEVLVAIGGITCVSDWIASDKSLFPPGRSVSTTPQDYLKESRDLARRALDRIGWFPRRPLARADFKTQFGFEPNPLQQLVGSMLQHVGGPVLMVIEAPMGMGKTEAALYAHTQLQNICGHRGLYVAMPTVATGNSMFSRVKEFLAKAGDRPVDIQLQHGTARLSTEFRSLLVESVDEDIEQTVLASEWFTARKRAMLSEYGIGTVDQALLGALRVRHHFVRLFGLGNRTVVLDEVHAYDTYTSTLIERLVGWLAKQGSSVILLSATLPRQKRLSLIQAYGAVPNDEPIQYPRVTVAESGHLSTTRGLPVENRIYVRVRGIPKDVKSVTSTLMRLAGKGGCVAYVANTVGRAQAAYQAIGRGQTIVRVEGSQEFLVGKIVDGIEIYLFHARYPSNDRRAREMNILDLFGENGYKKGKRPRNAIVIATQVIEQSLNIDFDAMITDLAPIDLLLQRLGRLHRFDEAKLKLWGSRRHDQHRDPEFWVAGLSAEPPSLDEWREIYPPYLLLMAWWLLRDREGVTLPDEIEKLVDTGYGKPPVSELDGSLRHLFEEAYQSFRSFLDHQRTWAEGVSVQNAEDLISAPRDKLAAMRLEDEEDQHTQYPLTRYGEPSLLVVPLHSVNGHLYLDAEGRYPVSSTGPLSDEDAERVFDRSVRLGGKEIFDAVQRIDPLPSWKHHPLLRTLRPLELVDGRRTIGSFEVELDRELGVVYRRIEG